MSKLLVTGGAGFIGSNFIHYWLQKYPEDQIVNLDKLTYSGNLENLEDIEKQKNYTFIKGDICDEKSVEKAMKNCDIVVNFAAESHVDRSIMDPQIFLKTNVLGTQVLLDQALKQKIKRFHHISTDEVFGSLSLDSEDKFSETTRYNPRSPYAASKAASDHLVNAYFHTYNLPTTISNCANNFGPYHYPEKLIPLAITNLLEDKKVPIYGDGLYVREWLYVEDHCRGIEAVIKKGKVGETYCIGVDMNTSNVNIVKKILKILGRNDDMIEYVKDRPGHDRRYAIDATKIKKELGWESIYSFDEALEMTVSWFIQHEKWWKKLKDKSFKDYYAKQYKTAK